MLILLIHILISQPPNYKRVEFTPRKKRTWFVEVILVMDFMRMG